MSSVFTRSFTALGALTLVAMAGAPAEAEVLRLNTPAVGLTIDRIGALPDGERGAWVEYLARSQAQHLADRAALAAELPPGATPPPPPQAVGPSQYNMPLDRASDWYGSAQARRIADAIVSFQTPAGGWSKNQDRTIARLPGQRFSNDAETMEQNPANFDAPADRFWTFVGTLDNEATWTEMRFLAKVAAHAPGAQGDAWRASIERGVRYLLDAQYPNGGWPQIWPLEGGFHDSITFNDNAVANAAMLLRDVSEGREGFDFVSNDLKSRAGEATHKAVEVILAAQVRQGDRLLGWPQQVEPMRLVPTSARNYEPRSIASGETTDILIFLMREPNPSAELKAAVRGAAAWLEAVRVYDKSFEMTDQGRKLIDKPGAGPIWSRNYDLVTGRPIFGDKDQTIHDDVNEISIGRRNGYSWWITSPQRALDLYAVWSAENG
ncbi:pectate lyase [Brevundimonas sp. Bb-A]|uniref:pectate lyase n=1 Tax=Brevundimonas sp. Bb-A TaxID=2560058 RepID=UPI0012A8C8CE|nr:pectate lyase [Brevundimonas sp. Bb-A]QFU31364.1 Pectic acid lyase [Brevundimonas sp. Bb-A]